MSCVVQQRRSDDPKDLVLGTYVESATSSTSCPQHCSDIPSFDVPSFDVPSFDVPSFDVPSFDVAISEIPRGLVLEMNIEAETSFTSCVQRCSDVPSSDNPSAGVPRGLVLGTNVGTETSSTSCALVDLTQS
jgi:hypothetical protein